MERKNFVVGGVAALSLLMFTSANAAWVDCSAPVEAAVTNTDDCEVSTVYDNDPASAPIEVNEDGGAFGFTDWELILQGQAPTSGEAGSWSIPLAAQSLYDTFLVVFKDGAGTFLTAYITTEFSGTWTDAIFGGKDISHISYYGRGEPRDVPEPATLGLLGLGLAGLGLGARRRRKI